MDALLATGPWPIDGGLATHLEFRGHDISGSLWSARILADDPGAIRDAHRDYVDAGARVLVTASYQVSRQGFVAAGRTAEQADAALRRSVDVAREAAADSEVLVAASVGPYGAITHDGGEYRGRYGLTHEQLVEFHAERVAVLVDAGPDLLAIETIPDADEAAALVDVLADHPDIAAWMTFSCGSATCTWAGQSIGDAVAVAAQSPSVRAVGVNCVDPALVAGLLQRIRAAVPLPMVAYPNAGRVWLPETESWSPASGGSGLPPEAVDAWLDAGVALLGGCCMTGPSDIAGIATASSRLRGGISGAG